MPTLKLSSPWITFYREIVALFVEDPDIRIEYVEDDNEIRLYVENAEKAEALMKLLPPYRTFGNITVTINVIPANSDADESKAALVEAAFKGNPVLSFMRSGDNPLTSGFNYAVFRNEVVQFFNDELNDINGNKSTLFQEIAKDVFGTVPGVYFCTDASVG